MTALNDLFGPRHLRTAGLILASALMALAPACGGGSEGGEIFDAGHASDARVLPDPDGGAADAGGGTEFSDASADDAGNPGEDIDAGAPEDGGFPLILKSISPPRGSIDGGTPVTLIGSGFFRSFASGATDAVSRTHLFIGGREASGLTVINDLRLEALAPAADAAGAADVVLQNPSGEARCGSCFAYFVPLSLSAFTPASGSSAGGDWVTLSGRGFTQDMQVYFGGVRSPAVQVSGDGEARAMTPAVLTPGTAAVVAVGEGGIAQAAQGFSFEAPMALVSAEPRVVPLEGNVEVRLAGTSLFRAALLRVAGESVAFSLNGDGTLSFSAPQSENPGTASVVIQDAAGNEAALDGGLTWAEAGSGGEAPFSVLGAFPGWVSSGGGDLVTVTGSGLEAADALFVNGQEIPSSQFSGRTPGTLTFPSPSGAPGSQADVTLSSADGQTRTLAAAFRYRLRIDAVSPGHGAAGDAVTLQGEGFRGDADYEVRFGTLTAAAEVTGPGSLSVYVPLGQGMVDVTAAESGNTASGSTLKQAFTYDEPLALFAVSPSSGTVVGGDEVTVYGAGFAPGISIRVGGASLKDVALMDSSRLRGRVPAGNAGSADVSAALDGRTVLLPGGYAYRDPAASIGGSSGESLSGTLNVTVFRSSSVRIPGVSVEAFADGALLASGITDESGQASLHSPLLNRPVRVVFRRDGYRTLAVEAQASGNLSVFLTQDAGASSQSSADPFSGGIGSISSGGSEAPAGDIPPGSTAAGGGTADPDYTLGSETPVLSGTVSGFKLPRELAPGEIAMAEVFSASASYLSLPPFSSGTSDSVRDLTGERWRVTSDGGPFTIYGRQGQQTLYALFGIYDTVRHILTPSLMGIARAVPALPTSPGAGVDILLDMHLDAALRAVIEDPDAPQTEGDFDAPLNSLYAWLSLGNDGYIAFGPAVGYGPLELKGLPRLSADNFIFLNRSSSADGAATGYCFRRTEGSLSDGLSIGPMVGQSRAVVPDAASAVLEEDAATGQRTRVFPFDGIIRWKHVHGTAPDIQRLNLRIVHGDDGTVEFLEAVMPGTQTSWDISGLTRRPVNPALDTADVTYESNRAPRFDYDFWSYSHFSTSSLSCWTFGSFQLPLREAVPEAEGAK